MFLLLVIFFINESYIYCQLFPKDNFELVIDDYSLKKVCIFKQVDNQDVEQELIAEIEIDTLGLIRRKAYNFFWSYSLTEKEFLYSYNSEGNIRSKLSISRYKDSLKLERFEKEIYEYDSLDMLKKITYSQIVGLKDKSVKPLRVSEFSYNSSNKLIMEVSYSIESHLAYDNYVQNYVYLEHGQLYKKTLIYDNDPLNTIKTFTYSYNDFDKLIEEKIELNNFPHDNRTFEYQYDLNNKLIEKSCLIPNNNERLILDSRTYNKLGQLEQSNGSVYFYNEQGLIEKEIRTDSSGNFFVFKTTYEYWK